jgi:fungal STAND N-terminal Goodbye domain
MSLTRQATSSSNVQLIIGALADYSKETGIDLSNTPFATALEQSNSPEAILQLLQQREKAFKEYRDDNRRLINCLSPAVKVLQAFSGILGEAVSLVSHTFCPDRSFNITSSGPLPPSKGVVRRDRCAP